MDEEDKRFLSFWGGIFLGAGIYAAIFDFPENDIFNNAKAYKTVNGRSVIRLYRSGADQILVGEDETGTNYTTLKEYLNKIQDPNERKVERAKIEQLVRWED